MLTLTKEQSTFAKGIAILVMVAHHLYAFPDRFDYIWGHPYLIQLGQDFGVVVGLFVFLNGIGLTATREKSIKPNRAGQKLVRVYKEFWKIAVPFLLIGFLFGYFEYDAAKVVANLTFWDSSYNHEWWYMKMYVEFLLVGFIVYRIKGKRLLSAVTIITGLLAIYAQHHYGIPFPEKLKHVGGLLHYWPTFVLALNVYIWNLFDITDRAVSHFVSFKYMRVFVYLLIALLIHYYAPSELRFFQFFFYYIIICFVNVDGLLGKTMVFFGKHSLNIWLMHTFICYYYWQEWFLTISFGKWYIAFVNLVLISLLTSIILNTMYEKSSMLIKKIF